MGPRPPSSSPSPVRTVRASPAGSSVPSHPLPRRARRGAGPGPRPAPPLRRGRGHPRAATRRCWRPSRPARPPGRSPGHGGPAGRPTARRRGGASWSRCSPRARSPRRSAGFFGSIAASGANVDRIVRLSRYPVTSYELVVSGGDPDRLRRELGREAARLPGRRGRAAGRPPPPGQAPDRARRRLDPPPGRGHRPAGRPGRRAPGGGGGDRGGHGRRARFRRGPGRAGGPPGRPGRAGAGRRGRDLVLAPGARTLVAPCAPGLRDGHRERWLHPGDRPGWPTSSASTTWRPTRSRWATAG